MRRQGFAGRQVDAGAGGNSVAGRVSGIDGTQAVLQAQAGARAAIEVGIDVDVMLGAQGQLIGAPAHAVIDIDVTGAAGGATVAFDGDVATAQFLRQLAAADVTARSGDGEVDGVDDPLAGLTVGGAGSDAGAILHGNVSGRGIDGAAVAAHRCAGVQAAAAGEGDLAVSHQADAAALILDGLRFDNTAVVDDRRGQGIHRFGAQDNPATVSLDQLAIAGQGIERAAIRAEAGQRAIVDSDADLVARAQQHGAERGGDGALITDLWTQQGDITTAGRRQAALVGDAGGTAAIAEAVVAGHEVAVTDVQGSGNQAVHIDLCALAEEHAIGIDQENLTIGVEVAENGRRVLAHDTVQGDGKTVGLDEVDGFTSANIEALPVDGQQLALLIDGGGGAAAGDAAATRTDGSPRGRRQCRRTLQGQRGQ